MSGELEQRIAEAEAIIRAKNELTQAMYDSDLESLWPDRHYQLERAYQERYGVNLDHEDT